MPVEVILPKVDMDMTHGTLAVWHVAEGQAVTKGAALFDIETDKAAMEVEAPASGTLHHIAAASGDKVAVGSIVAWIYAPGETVVARPASGAAAATPVMTAVSAPVAAPMAAEPEPEADDAAIRATPAARALAQSRGIALSDVQGTGPLGRVQRDDVAGAGHASTYGDWSPQSGPLHISRRNGTGTPIVLIHGLTADSQSWAPLEKALGPQQTLIRIDLPGHGRSPRRQLRSFADLARMMVEAFDDVTRDAGPVHLVGHSLGGALALAISDIRPRRVASLTLIAPAGFGPEIDGAALNGITRASRVESLAPWLRRLTATSDGISDDYAMAAMKLRTDPALRAVQAAMADALFPDGVQSFDLSAALGRVAAPTCVIWGRQDHILPFRQALAVTGDFAIHLLAGAGHVPQIECPDRVARIMARHLAASGMPEG